MTPISREVLSQVYGQMSAAAASIIDAGNDANPQLLIFSDTGEWLGNVPEDLVGKLHSEMMGSAGKVIVMHFVNQILAHRGDIVVHIVEAWAKHYGPEEKDEKVAEDLAKYKKVSNLPGRTEAMVVTLHTREKSYVGISPVVTGADGKRHVDLQPLHFDAHAEGAVVRPDLTATREKSNDA